MARDAGTKKDAPPSDRSPDREEKAEQEGPDSPVGQEQGGQTTSESTGRAGAKGAEEAEKKAKPKRKPAAKSQPPTRGKAEGTASSKTKVDKAGAEAALDEGAAEPKDEAEAKPKKKPAAKKTTTAKAKADDKPKADDKAEDKPAKGKAKPAASAKEASKSTAEPKRARRNGRDAADLVTVRAQAKYVRTSARKARLVADHVRGKDVAEARALLAFSPRSVAEDWRKLLESAIANAEHNHDLVGDNLRVLNATADEGPTLKRFRPRAMGRATRIRKRTSHLTITLTPKETR